MPLEAVDTIESTPTASAFFYGTLMHPKILRRVIGNNGKHLQICPAVLLNYTRHQVKYADYPGILPYERSKEVFGLDLDVEERSVRGTMVVGLSSNDIALLDVFEGSEYTRDKVFVRPLGPLTEIPDLQPTVQYALVPADPPPLPQDISQLAPPVEVQTYVYRTANDLGAALWSFDDFVKENAWKWTGNEDKYDNYTEIDRRNNAAVDNN